ncbi:hypothetical protein LI328DRAFT_63386 [Trichoderma asperelloides]|nr:hypothetical protein LI328DRAFT_63386 [Trichoderma asperelloides]
MSSRFKTHGKDHGLETSNHHLDVSPVLALSRLIVQIKTGNGQLAARHCRQYAFYLFYLAAIASPVQLSWRLFDTLEMGWDAVLQYPQRQIWVLPNSGRPSREMMPFHRLVPAVSSGLLLSALCSLLSALCSLLSALCSLLSALFIDEHCSWPPAPLPPPAPILSSWHHGSSERVMSTQTGPDAARALPHVPTRKEPGA